MTTDNAIARTGLLVRDLAAAGGPIIRLKISRAPTTGTVTAVARATRRRNAISMRWLRTPLASATSGTMEESMRGRYRTATAAMQAMLSAATGRIWVLLTPSTS